MLNFTNITGITWKAANVPAARLNTLGVDAINVGTDGTTAAIEQARTLLESAHAYPVVNAALTIGDIIKQDNSSSNHYQQLANVVILISLLIAGCTLATGIAAGLADRKRPFSLLRLTGARLATLRRVVALEGAVPLLAIATVAIGTGFGAAAMYASQAQQHPMVAPGAATTFSQQAGWWCPSASSRLPSRCWPASPDPRSQETNEPASPAARRPVPSPCSATRPPPARP